MLNLNIQNKMEDEGNMITDWLDKHGDPKIEKQVEKMLEVKEIERAAANLADPNICKTDNWIAGAKWGTENIYSGKGINYLQGFIDQFGDGVLGELDATEWDALEFLEWLKLNNYEIVKKK